MNRAAVIIVLLGLAVGGQAMLLSATNGTGLVCSNDTIEVQCGNSSESNRYPELCCNFGAGDVCCEQIPELLGIILGAVVACCVVCLLVPLLVILCCCCLMGAACCGGSGNKMRIVKSGYQRV